MLAPRLSTARCRDKVSQTDFAAHATILYPCLLMFTAET